MDIPAVAAPAFAQFFGVLHAFGERPGGELGKAHADALNVVDARRLGGEGDGTGGASASGSRRGSSVVVAYPARAQSCLDGFAGHGPHIDAPATAANGLDNRLGGGGDEDEDGVGRRFFEGLQNGVPCLVGEAVRRFEDDDAEAAFIGEARDEVRDATHLADADVAGIGVAFVAAFSGAWPAEGVSRPHNHHVRMAARFDQPARAALAAGHVAAALVGIEPDQAALGWLDCAATFAVEHARQFEGEARTARALHASHQECVGRLGHRGDGVKLREYSFVANEGVHADSLRGECLRCPDGRLDAPVVTDCGRCRACRSGAR